jgi:HK97 family phage major capsid protein
MLPTGTVPPFLFFSCGVPLILKISKGDRQMAAPLKLFRDAGEQLAAIAEAAYFPASIDPRLLEVNASITGAGTAPLSDGGFLIQQDLAQKVFQAIQNEGELVRRCKPFQLRNGAQRLRVPVNIDASRADGSRFGGTSVSRTPEGGTRSTAFRRRLSGLGFETTKLTGTMPVTKELARDAIGLEALIMEGFAKEAAFVLDLEIFSGTGGSCECLGLMNSGALITVAKETNQPASTILHQNVLNMWTRSHIPSRKNSVWLINPDIESQLFTMTMPVSASNLVPMWSPPTEYSPSGYLMGRPILPLEQTEALGTTGDIVLADLSQYGLIQKENSPEFDVSLHVYFMTDEQCFKFTLYVNGQPLWSTPMTPYSGGATRSPFVALATRS